MNWLARIVRRRRLYDDLSEEMRQHLEEKIDDLMAGGLSRADATAAARRGFGNVVSLEQRGRDVWRWMWLEDLLGDMWYAVRQLRRQPTFTIVAVLTLALGIGANTAVFSVVNAVVLRPLPFPDPDRLVSFQSLNTQRTPRPGLLSYPNFFDVRADNRVFERLVSYRDNSFSLTTAAHAIHVEGQIVSWDLFALLGVEPPLGRGFVPDEEHAGSRVVILGHALWQGQFAGDPTIVGRSIVLNGEPFTVVAVAPEGFRFPVQNPSVQLWTTLAIDAGPSSARPITVQRGNRSLNAIGRLKPGLTLDQAIADTDVLAARLATQYPEDNVNLPRVHIQPEIDRVVGGARGALFVLLGSVGIVLVIACANLANLLLARTAEREREFAVRASMGASRPRIIRQLLTEGLVLALLGGIAGVFLASACIQLLPAILQDVVPRLHQATVDRHVLGFTAAIVLFTCVVFSASPAWQLLKVDLVGHLKDGSRTLTPARSRLRGALVIGQIALSLALVSGASLLVASFVRLVHRDLGFRLDHVLRFSVSLPGAQYGGARGIAFYDQLFERVSHLPGVLSVAGGGPLPMMGNQMSIRFDIPGRPTSAADRPGANVAIVTPGYFRTLGIPLLEGRDFTDSDRADSLPVVIVNQAFADRFFSNDAALGKTIRPGMLTGPEPAGVRQIVGIVGNARQQMLTADAEPIYYVAFRQVPWSVDSVLMRTAVAPATLAAAVRATVSSIDKLVPVRTLGTLEELQSSVVAIPRFGALFVGGFAGISLLLAAVGLYGVVSHAVGRRTGEIGVRMALGATRHNVVAMVLRQALMLVAIGLAIGVAAAATVSRLLATVLYGVTPGDPLLLGVACSAIVLASLAATYVPARRAAAIDPMRALRDG